MTDTLDAELEGIDLEIIDDDLEAVPTLEEQRAVDVEDADEAGIPDVKISDKLREEIELWLMERISTMKSERQDLERTWAEIEELYELTSLQRTDENGEETWEPFEHSARLVVQLIAIYTETIWAKLIGTIHAPSDPFSTKPISKEFLQHYRPLRKFISWSCEHELGLRKHNTSAFMDLVKLGTCVTKTIYTREDKLKWVYDPATRKHTKTSVRVQDCPEIIHCANEDVLYPASAKELAKAEIVGHRIALTYAEVKRRLRNGLFKLPEGDGIDAVTDLRAWVGKKRTDIEESLDAMAGLSSRDDNKLEFYEIYFEYGLPGSSGDNDGKHYDDSEPGADNHGLPVALIGWINTDTGRLFRLRYNDYPLGNHPFDSCAFIPRPHRIPGIGVGHMAMAAQREVTAMHNQRLDSATIANAHVTFIKDDSLLPINFKVIPGGTYRVSDPNEIQIKPLGQAHQSTINEENHVLSLVERRIGAHEYSPESKVNTSTQAIVNMQELTRKFDVVVGNVREFLTQIMKKVLLLYQQHYPTGKAAMIMGEDGEFIEQIFTLPPNIIEIGVAISVTATTSSTSKELDRQSKLSLFNLVTQYYGQLTQYVIQANNPQLPPMVQAAMLRIVDALGELVRGILEDFDVPERDRIAIGLGELPPPGQPGGMGAGGPGASGQAQPQGAPQGQAPGGPQGSPPPPGMGGLQ